MKLRNGYRRPAERLRRTVESMPRRSREAMLRGIDGNRIVAGTYTDPRSGGVCPMLAAHRNGGRTDMSNFAIAWDIFTGASKPRRATRREVAALRSYLEMSLLAEGAEYSLGSETLSDAASRIRSERSTHRASALVADAVEASRERIPEHPAPGGPDEPATDRDRGRELRRRSRWSWIRPTRRYDTFRDRVAAASEERAEQRADELLDREPRREPSLPSG